MPPDAPEINCVEFMKSLLVRLSAISMIRNAHIEALNPPPEQLMKIIFGFSFLVMNLSFHFSRSTIVES